MNGKERMRLALAHREPDRVPVGEMGIDYPVIEAILGHPTYYRAQGKERRAIWDGQRDAVVRSQKEDLVALARALEWDFVPVWLTYSREVDYRPTRFLREDRLTWEDAAGNTWQAPSEIDDGLLVRPAEVTRETLKALTGAPLQVDESQLELARHVVEELGETHFIIARGWHAPSTWTDGTFPLPGEGLALPVHEFLMLMYEDPDLVHAILEAYTHRAIEYGKVLISAGVDAVQINTDYCINTGPWLSPAMFRKFILPYMQAHVDAYHQAGVKVLKHTDGNTWKILDMLLDTGIDGLHGIQPGVGMEIRLLKEKTRGRAALFGAVEAETLINGTEADVEREVCTCLRYGAPGGGYVLTSSNSVQVGTKPENYRAMLRAGREYGRYPLDWAREE